MKKAIDLTKIASWLYHNDPDNQARFEIYLATEGKHPQDEILTVFSTETKKAIQFVTKKLECAENKRILELKKIKKHKKRRRQ